jgi:hypothetical protein
MAIDHNSAQNRLALKQLLIQQFMLHEIQHHELQATDLLTKAAIVPKAHGLVDIYKCLHQGEFGVGHSIEQPAGFRQQLENECKRCLALGSADDREPVLETVSCDGQMLRVNLRPLGHRFQERLDHVSDLLTRVCLQSAQHSRGKNDNFLKTLELFEALNQAGEICLAGQAFIIPAPLTARFLAEVRQFAQRVGQVPVLSHSAAYRRLNHPAYRVADREALKSSDLNFLLAEEKIDNP